MSARFVVADVFDGLATLDDGSVHSVITSPPYWRKRDYTDDPREFGKETSPADYLSKLLRVTDELWRIVRDDGSIWFNLGDTAAYSGGWGSDVDRVGRGGGRRWNGTNGAGMGEMPRPKSVCWIPELFGASLAYGRNLLSGEPCRQWITRPSVTWCKPAPTPGEIIDKFREATELFVWAAKQPSYYFDLDAVREPPHNRAANPKGVPPKNWWVINTANGETDHVAPFPTELIHRPVIVSCPVGGTILDPFAGSGTVGVVAVGNERNAVLVDLDERNMVRARERIGFFFDSVEVDQ